MPLTPPANPPPCGDVSERRVGECDVDCDPVAVRYRRICTVINTVIICIIRAISLAFE